MTIPTGANCQLFPVAVIGFWAIDAIRCRPTIFKIVVIDLNLEDHTM